MEFLSGSDGVKSSLLYCCSFQILSEVSGIDIYAFWFLEMPKC